MTTKVPSIPNLTEDNIQQVLTAAKEILEVREGLRGDPLDKNVTYRDLEALKLVQETATADTKVNDLPVQVLPAVNPTVFAADNYDESSDLSTPPTPTNLEATGGYSSIYLSWQYEAYKNHAYTEVYRSYVDDISTAALIGSTPGTLFTDPVGTEITAYYWVRNISQANVESPYNSAGGTMAETAVDVSRAIAQVTADIEALPIYSDLATSIADLETATASAISRVSQVESQTASLTDTLVAVNGQSKAGLQIQATVSAALGGQYSVKIDANGHVAGFGLSNTLVNDTPTSAFIIRADKFAIVDPSSTSDNLTNTPTAASIPFVVSGGNTYIKAAFIQDATITNAKIESVAADKITAGTITAAIDMRAPLIRSGAVTYGQAGFFLGSDSGTNKFYIGNGTTGASGRELSFNGTDVTVRGTIYAYAGNISNVSANNITIYDSAGGVLLSSGSGVRASDLLNSSVSLGTLGAGSLAYLNQVSTTYIADLAVNTLKIAGNAVTSASVFTGSGDIPASAGSSATIVSGTFTSSGTQPILVTLSTFIGGGYSSGSLNTVNADVSCTIYFGGYSQASIHSLTSWAGNLVCGTGSVLFTGIPAGTYSVYAQMNCNSSGAGIYGVFARQPKLIVLETKR